MIACKGEEPKQNQRDELKIFIQGEPVRSEFTERARKKSCNAGESDQYWSKIQQRG